MFPAEGGVRLTKPDRGGEARIADELHALTRDGASGALKIDGDSGGTIYLDRGYLTFAEAAGVPGLAARLIGSRRLSAEQWNMLRTERRPADGFGALLVEQGLIGKDEMLEVLRSVVLDAITAMTAMTAMTARMAGGSSATGIRFMPLERSWAGTMLRLEVEFVQSEVARRAELLAGHDVSLDGRPKASDLRGPLGIVEREQWMVACRIDGVATLRELAWRNGFALYDTVASVSGLVRAGLCTLLAPEEAVPPQREEVRPARGSSSGVAWLGPAWAVDETEAEDDTEDDTGDDTEELPRVVDPEATVHASEVTAPSPESAGDAVRLMPRRSPGATTWDRARVGTGSDSLPQGLEEVVRTPFAPVHPDILGRVLEGLRRLK
ncbi:DUF4388 domain-containing protein [Microtetraspora malaysiensis]|uniref:DUF4388 domain-containing protein n=1 Tax=Microtetraspora malaysiensis TaxID=161358 RepID=A0ABW6SS70_9ACTN